MATNIPKARELISEVELYLRNRAKDQVQVGNQRGADRLNEMAGKLREARTLMQRKVKHNERTIARKITPEIVQGVLLMKQKHPHLTYLEIGERFGINGGRVSEILNGQRTVEKPGSVNDGRNRRRA